MRKKNKLQNFEKRRTKILIIGGHMTPALAVVDELLEMDYDNVLWVGHKKSQTGDKNLSAEYREVARRGLKFQSLETGKIWRKWTVATIDKALLNLIRIPFGFLKAFFILLFFRPNIIISFGGYLSVPIILNFIPNKLNRAKIYIHSQTIRPDLSIKLTHRFADKLFLSWDESKKYYKHKNIKVVRIPLNKTLGSLERGEKIFDNELPILLVMGGNQGANTFNRRLKFPMLENYLEIMNVIHQTGSSTVTQDYQVALSQIQRLDEPFKSRYKVYPYILPEELNQIYNHTSLILARSGANTVQEIMLKGVPTVFMPIPWAQNNEQFENAQIAANTGLAKIFEFKDGMKSEELLKVIKSALDQAEQRESFKEGVSWSKAKEEAKSLIRTDSAKEIVAELKL